MFEVFEHTADLGLRVRAADADQLFAEAGRGLFSVIVANLDAVQPVQTKTYHLEGDDYEYLLFDWLSELLYTFETEKLLLSQFQVKVTDAGVDAVCRGETMDSRRHEMDHEIKAITYHRLKVQQTEAGWLAELIVDI
ncbi:MAG: archease [Planctomycetales bacterium]|nr:archease [Planctomycetales bacterium]